MQNAYFRASACATCIRQSIFMRKTRRASTCALARMTAMTVPACACPGSAGNRLDVFACSPAPVQATWLGYPNTSGLSTVRYRVADAIVDPLLRKGEERSESSGEKEDANAPVVHDGDMQQWTEEVYYLPRSFLCYDVAAFLRCPETPPRWSSRPVVLSLSLSLSLSRARARALSLFLSLSLSLKSWMSYKSMHARAHVYYICVCLCVCVCARARARMRATNSVGSAMCDARIRHLWLLQHSRQNTPTVWLCLCVWCVCGGGRVWVWAGVQA